MGTVTVSEVGLLKRDIAFHGDTVNTTSRIHDFCNKYQQQMLISQNLRDRLNSDDVLELSYIGDHILKGKHISMELFGVKRAKQPVDRQMVNKTLAPARPVDSQHLPPVKVQAASTSSQGSVPSKSRVIS
jgi:hypothetical protein